MSSSGSKNKGSTSSSSLAHNREYFLQKIKPMLAGLAVHQKVFSKDDIVILNHCHALIEKAHGRIDGNFQVPTNAVQPLTIALKNPYALLAQRAWQEIEKGKFAEQCKEHYGPTTTPANTLKPATFLGVLTILLPDSTVVLRVYGEHLRLLRLAEMVVASAQPPASPIAIDGAGGASPIIVPSVAEMATTHTETTTRPYDHMDYDD